jgi:Ca2+-binding RTX toxin-like protein
VRSDKHDRTGVQYAGCDTFVIGRGSDTAFGGAGDDTLILDPDWLDAPIGPTAIFGGHGEDRPQLFSI